MACWRCMGLIAITLYICICTIATAATTEVIDIAVYLHSSASSDAQQPTTLLTDADPANNLLDSVASEPALLFGSTPKTFAAAACHRWQGSEQSWDVKVTQAARPGRQQLLPGGLQVTQLTGCDSGDMLLGVQAEARLSTGLDIKVFCSPYSELCRVYLGGSKIAQLMASSSRQQLERSDCGLDEAGRAVTCTVMGPVSAEGCEQLHPWLQPHCQPGMLGVRVWPASPESGLVSLLPELVASPAPSRAPLGSMSGFLRSSGGDNAWASHLRSRRMLQ